jgi:hypothetical protein
LIRKNCWSGLNRSANPAPINNSAIEPGNGRVQLPVRSIVYPNTHGEMMPAMPKPKFMMPLAEPA